jgi:hypothetical protein
MSTITDATPIAALMLRDYQCHGRFYANAATNRHALELWRNYFGETVVADLTRKRVDDFVRWLEAQGCPTAIANRTLMAGALAFRRAGRPNLASIITGIRLGK